eukprot:197608-Heterocapsa_arctica.AAC.1
MSGPRSHWRSVSSRGVQSKARYSAGGSQPCLLCAFRWPVAPGPGVAAVPPFKVRPGGKPPPG